MWETLFGLILKLEGIRLSLRTTCIFKETETSEHGGFIRHQLSGKKQSQRLQARLKVK
jgi:hypothetical protein